MLTPVYISIQLILSTILFILIQGSNAQYPGGEYLSQKAKSCSFTDEATGYQAIWHTNCTGKVNFVLNFRNFPQSVPMSIGMNNVGMGSDNYWTGIGFKLLSWEVALVENLDGYVAVTSARLNPGQPPQREVGGGILVNPHGQFFSGQLEATFAIDESLLTGCKEWTFFTKPARVGTPYGGQPYTRIVCNVAETCSRNQCGPPIYDPYSAVGVIDDQPQTSILNGVMGGYVLSNRLYGGGNMGYLPQSLYNAPTITQALNSPSFQQPSSYYGGNRLGSYSSTLGYGNNYDYNTGYQRANGYGLNYVSNPNYRFYSPNAFQGLQQQAYSPYYQSQLQQGMYSPQYGYGYNAYGYGGAYNGIRGSLLTDFDRLALQHATDPFAGIMSKVAKRRRRVLRQVNFGRGMTFVNPQTNSGMTYVNQPTNFGALNGTAYEGQDRQFVREPINYADFPPGYVNPQYQYDPSASANRRQYFDPQTNTFYYTGMYYPYRTEVANDNLFEDYKNRDTRLYEGQTRSRQIGTPNILSSPTGVYRDPPAVNGAIPQRFLDPCDGGADPFWCTEYIGKMTRSLQGSNQRPQNPQSICPALVESLKNSDHKCCNALKNLGCFNA